MSGNIQYDNTVRTNGAFKDIVYITDPGTTYFDSLTTFDYLFYAARLRTSHGKIECLERARVISKLMGLDGASKLKEVSHGKILIERIN
jgi:ABC-type multidrug transport system ATPase subunit